MDVWESYFREKSRRRSRQSVIKIGKTAILALLFAEFAVAAIMYAR